MTLSARSILDYCELMRLKYGLTALFLVYLAYTLSSAQYYFTFQLDIALVAAFFLVSASSVLNNYIDVELDLINNSDRALPRDGVKKSHALYFSVALFALANLFSALAGLNAMLIFSLATIAVVVYELFIKKNYPYLKIIFPGLFAALIVLLGALLGENFYGAIWLSISLFLAVIIDTLVNELKSYVNKEEIWASLPQRAGKSNTALLDIFFTSAFVSVSPLPYLLGILGRNYLLVVAVADLLLLYAAVKILAEESTVHESYKIERIGILFFLLAWLTAII